MGISESGGDVDCSVGTIVWVRRRNGSWWPGRILGPNELSASHLMSPRSGTPVKLLGREDASVDWYNLEKSKRVKAFRCGEFDDCIIKAESSQGIPIKKREKYARREDAILHALELERQQLEKKQHKLGVSNSTSSKMPSLPKKELGSSSEPLGNNHTEIVSLKSQAHSKALDSSLEEESTENPAYPLKTKHVKLQSLEDDNSEAIPRMRGLQDFGLRIAPIKKKLPGAVCSESPQRHSSGDNREHDFTNVTHSVDGSDHVPSTKNSLALKRKRSQGGLLEESLVKRRDRRRPLVQVLQNTAKLPASQSLTLDGDAISLSMQGEKEQTGVTCKSKRSRCVYLPAESNECLDRTEFSSEQMQLSPSQPGNDNCHLHPGSLTEENTSSGMMDEAESDSSQRDYFNPDGDEETAMLSDSTQTHTVMESRNSRRYMSNVNNGLVEGQTGSMSSEELDESAANGYMSRLHAREQTSAAAADVGMSKWQLKGKRNIRHLIKKSIYIAGKSLKGTYFEGKGNSLNRRGMRHSLYDGNEALSYDYDEDELLEKSPTQVHMMGFGNRRFPSLLRENSKRCGRSNDIIDSEEDSVWEADGLSQAAYRGYWDESSEGFDPLYVGHHFVDEKEDMLVDVDLKVQASYQGEHVPLVSLMSRLNGKAIIGHPIQLEALEDGSTDLLLSANDDLNGEPMDNDGNVALTPVWTTARRTAMQRVPRPHPLTALDGDEAADPSQYLEPEYRKSHAGHSNPKARKNFSNIHQPLEKKCTKKPIKKVSLSNQKTRTLSSIAIEQKSHARGTKFKVVNKSNLGGLIKPETGPTTVTCIPVKLVFSRLLEAVGRPPSRITNHSVSINGDTEK